MSYGSWGIELWDQSENLLKYSNEQVSSIDVYFHLFWEIQKLQHDFGKRLRKMVITFQRKKPPAQENLTFFTSFDRLVQTLSALGSIFEAGSKELGDQVVGNLKQLYDNERKETDNRRISFSRLNQSLDQSRKQLDTAWQKYVNAYKDRQKAHDNWLRGEKELPPPRIEQLKELYLQKRHSFDQFKAQYASELNKYNNGLRQHYNKAMVEQLEELSLKASDRIDRTKELLQKMTKIYEDTCTRISDSVRSMQDIVGTIDSSKDDELVISHFKTGEFVPVDLPFLDLERCPRASLEGSPHSLGSFMLGIEPSQPCSQLPGSSAATVGSTGMLSGLKRGPAKASREDYANLRSPFVCDISTKSLKDTDFTIVQLADRLRELSEQIKRTESETEGTQRLLVAYRGNSSLGSPETVEPKVNILKRRLVSLQEQVKQLQNRYEQLGGDQSLMEAQMLVLKIQSAATESGTASSLSHSHLTGEDSDNSFDSGESDIELNQTSTGHSAPSSVKPVIETTNPDAARYVGYATMKYKYAGNGSLCLAGNPGDFFYVVELDKDGSGWTSVVSKDGSRTGLVPTGYIDLTMY